MAGSWRRRRRSYGGSASDATHLATEFLCRYNADRRPYPAITLTANGEFMTAVCNDYNADEIFARQVWGLGAPGDLLIAFSTSGKSRNVLRALEEARARGLQSICFLGRDGGFTQVVYFTSEEAARAGERKETPPEMRAMDEEMGSLFTDATFYDLPRPWLFSP